jgi:hypothetical protein
VSSLSEVDFIVEVAQHSVPPTAGSLHVFKQFTGLRLDAVKAALSRPADQRVVLAGVRFMFRTSAPIRTITARVPCLGSILFRPIFWG